jgi:hypothetical protein
MSETISVNFNVQDEKREDFIQWLQQVTTTGPTCLLGYRADDIVNRREALQRFANEMETVLRRHDHKTSWRERPIEALVRLLFLELEEFKVALEFFETKDARKELIDCANFCLIVWDRLGLLDQNRNTTEQTRAER